MDEAEEALAEQYYRQVKELYFDAHKKAKATQKQHQHPPNCDQGLRLSQIYLLKPLENIFPQIANRGQNKKKIL